MCRPFVWLITLASAFTKVSVAQNLVPNPGFEEFRKCPGDYNQSLQEFSVPGWSSGNGGSPDHFHACSNGEADMPHNWAGVSQAFEGEGYAGLYLWMGIREYREYLQSELTSPLLKDSLYYLEFHYKLSSYSKFSVDRIGLLLSDNLTKVRHHYILPFTPTLAVVKDSALTKSTGLWEKASMLYKAKGGERYVTVGNFWDDSLTKTYSIKFRPGPEPMLSSASYYYIDRVQVIPNYILQERMLAQRIPSFSAEKAKLNTTYVLQHIQFAFDSYRLVPPSFQELDQVAEFLAKYPKVRVQLFGHTDDQGNDRYNLTLSKARANTVAAYLKSLGISADRIEAFGLGEGKPLVEETTDEARAINRRVEIKFIQ